MTQKEKSPIGTRMLRVGDKVRCVLPGGTMRTEDAPVLGQIYTVLDVRPSGHLRYPERAAYAHIQFKPNPSCRVYVYAHRFELVETKVHIDKQYEDLYT